MSDDVIPLGKRVLLQKMKEREGETFVPGGKIVMPAQTKAQPPAIGTVLGVGTTCEFDLQQGDKVMYARHSGQPVGDTDRLILYEADIIGKFRA